MSKKGNLDFLKKEIETIYKKLQTNKLSANLIAMGNAKTQEVEGAAEVGERFLTTPQGLFVWGV
jgi:hypothetical protein